MTVQIAPAPSGAVPTGTVQLFYGGAVLGTAVIQIVNGVAIAQFSVQFFANGTYTFSAQYLGSASSQPSSSNAVTVVV